jgi:hypothetical protein
LNHNASFGSVCQNAFAGVLLLVFKFLLQLRPFKSAENGARIQGAALCVFEVLGPKHPLFLEVMDDIAAELGLPVDSSPEEVWRGLKCLPDWTQKPIYETCPR